MKKLLKKLQALLAKLFGKDDAPSAPAVPVAPQPAPLTPAPSPFVEPSPVASETLFQAAQRRKIPTHLWVAIQLFSQSLPRGLTADQTIDAWLAADNQPPKPENPTIRQDGTGTYTQNLTDNDLRYLAWARDTYVRLKQNGDIFRDVLGFNHDDINVLANHADILNPGRHAVDIRVVTPELAQAVEAAFKKASS